MPITWTDAALNEQADTQAANVTLVGIHTGDPGGAGTSNEATGGSPAYARKDPLWEAAGDDGPLGSTTQPGTVGVVWGAPTFDLPAGTYTHFSFWDGSTFVGKGTIEPSEVKASQGTYQPNIALGPGPSGSGV